MYVVLMGGIRYPSDRYGDSNFVDRCIDSRGLSSGCGANRFGVLG